METVVSPREYRKNYKKYEEMLRKNPSAAIIVKEVTKGKSVGTKQIGKTPFLRFVEMVRKHPLKGLVRPEGDIF